MKLAALFCFLATCHASTQKPYNPCYCRSLAKYDNGVIYDRVDCCANWTAREPVEPVVQVAGVVYRLDRNQTRYELFSTILANQVDFPGEESVLYDPGNTYTNYTCRDFSCRRAVVHRNVSNATFQRCSSLYDDGTCVDYSARFSPFLDPPLCHNSSSALLLKCAIWVPIPDPAPDAWLTGTIVIMSVLAALTLLAMISAVCLDRASCLELYLLSFLLVYLLTLSLLTTTAVWRFERWMRLTEVDMGYATYHTCLIECAAKANTDLSLAQANQCDDLGLSCSGAPSAGDSISCRGCKDHSVDWLYIIAYNEFIQTAIIMKWVIMTLYAVGMLCGKTRNHGALFCVMLPYMVFVIMSGVLNGRVTIYGAHGMTQHSSPTGTPLIADLGMAWTICMSVWLFIFILGKAADIGDVLEARHPNQGAELVFCS